MSTWKLEARMAALEMVLDSLVEEIGELRERLEAHGSEAADGVGGISAA